MIYRTLVIALLATTAHAAELDETLPQPWHKNGRAPALERCLAGVDRAMDADGAANLSLRCDTVVDGFVGAMQSIAADHYLGRRMRFSARVKTEDVDGWGGLWMRVDDHGKPNAALATMQDRPIKGSNDWTQHSVVLDASQKAQWISFGFTMNGKGQVWISDLKFEPVGNEVPTTGRVLANEPTNLELAR